MAHPWPPQVAKLLEGFFYFQGWRDTQDMSLPGVVSRLLACVLIAPAPAPPAHTWGQR